MEKHFVSIYSYFYLFINSKNSYFLANPVRILRFFFTLNKIIQRKFRFTTIYLNFVRNLEKPTKLTI